MEVYSPKARPSSEVFRYDPILFKKNKNLKQKRWISDVRG
jgi:hypothetical protein